MEGFPAANDETILALSDPPRYTACPNPFLEEFALASRATDEGGTAVTQSLASHAADERAPAGADTTVDGRGTNEAGDERRTPLAVDVSEGKSDPAYQAFSYHTKVPHLAVQRYIEHFTRPGDLVFDGFCGAGMTGVAANQLGRRAILCDLSPAATFMAHVYCHPVDLDAAGAAFRDLAGYLRRECGWLYLMPSDPPDAGGAGDGDEIAYVIWSEVFACPQCAACFPFAEAGFDFATRRLRATMSCPGCGVRLSAADLLRVAGPDRKTKEVPVRVALARPGHGGAREVAPPEAFHRLQEAIDRRPIPYRYPDFPMMQRARPERGWGDMWRRGYHAGYERVSDFFSKRTLWLLAAALEFVRSASLDEPVRHLLLQTIVNLAPAVSKMRRAYQGIVPLVLYIPKLKREVNVIRALEARAAAVLQGLQRVRRTDQVRITTQSSTALPNVPDACVDYVFTDPPFGSNIIYSEVNFLTEAFLGAFTNQAQEAIISPAQGKQLADYQELMRRAFAEAHRILKPGRWITVEFHNSRHSVWNAIQEALQAAGFVVADVRLLDKRQVSFKQASASAAVRHDLVISAYKVDRRFGAQFVRQAGTPEAAWDFVRQHLAHVPVVVMGDGTIEAVAERRPHRLFDRMVAFHIQRGLGVPLSAPEFYAGLRQRFVQRDGMYFLPEQVPEYDRARLQVQEVAQPALLVSDEKSAIEWLRRQLDPASGGEPQRYQELLPKFLREVRQARHEALPELSDILAQNFLQDEAGRWYVPDPHRASDLEQLRRRALLREFADYLRGRGRLRQFRTEAIRAGFADAWARRDFATILKVAERLPEDVLQDDPDLLMYYDNASLRA